MVGAGSLRDVVAALSERERFVAAFTKAAVEQGYRGIDSDRVARYAGSPPERLALHFGSVDAGLLAAQEAFLEVLWVEAIEACEVVKEWPLRVQAGLRAVTAAMVEASAVARTFTVEAAASSLAAAERQFAAIDRYAALLQEGRSLYPQAASLPAATERTLIGGVASVLCDHLLAEDPGAIRRLEPQLVELLLIPYLGAGEARRIGAADPVRR
jgi:AcrR family transcriptional regulator